MKENNKNVLIWIWRVSGADKAKVAVMALVQSLLGAAAVASAWLLQGIINHAVAGQARDFWWFAAGFIGLTAGEIALRAVYRWLLESCQSSLENRFKNRLFATLLDRDYARVQKVHSGEWMNRLTSDTTVIAGGITSILPELCGMAVKLVGAISLLIYMLPGMAFVILPGGAVVILLTWALRKKMKKMHKKVQESDGRLRSFMTERLGAMLVLRVFGQENATAREGRQYMQGHRRARMVRNAFSNLCNTGFAVAVNAIYLLGAVYCGYGILSGTVSYGTFTAVLRLVSQISAPFANISGVLPRFYAALASGERLMEVEAYPQDHPDGSLSCPEARQLYEEGLEAIVLDSVRFTYPDGEDIPAVLKDLNLTVRKGDYVAFTGHSGCGKSTVLKLLLALYPLDGGHIWLRTGAENMELTSRYRALFAYVPQGNQLMSGTVRQVIAFGDETLMADDGRIQKALTAACAWDFVQQLENGVDTLLGERGAGLSEGQMQRLALARAILSDRPILLLDEATSALDDETEAAVLKNLRAMENKTVIVVTHRSAALDICDQQIHFTSPED